MIHRPVAIRSYRGKFAEQIHAARSAPKGFPPDVAQIARRKLIMLNNAKILADLSSPPGNRLEALAGDLAGRHSIRINDKWRIVFKWTPDGPDDVEIMDYHR